MLSDRQIELGLRGKPAIVGSGHAQGQHAGIGCAGRTTKGRGHRIEAQPGRQVRPVGQRRGVTQAVARVAVDEAAGRHSPEKCQILRRRLVGNRCDQYGRLIAARHGEREHTLRSRPRRVAGGNPQAQAADRIMGRRSTEIAGRGVEHEPIGQGAAIGQRRRVGQAVAIRIGQHGFPERVAECLARPCFEVFRDEHRSRIVGPDGGFDLLAVPIRVVRAQVKVLDA